VWKMVKVQAILQDITIETIIEQSVTLWIARHGCANIMPLSR